MNTKRNKNSVILIAAIMAVVITALFVVVGITALSVAAYIFALVGIAMFCAGNIYMLASPKSYPWFAAFPIRIWQYLIAEWVLSAIFVLSENLLARSLPVKWFVLFHIILLAVCLITLVMLNAGKEIIDKRGEEVKQKVAALRLVQTDAEVLIHKFPEYAKDLRQVADALRYSDPMSHSSLAVYEEQIRRGIAAMDNEEERERLPERCAELLRQIADRNTRVKMMKE
jgi:hypothetical protein